MANINIILYTNELAEYSGPQSKVGIIIVRCAYNIPTIYTMCIFSNTENPLSDIEFQELTKDTRKFENNIHRKQFDSIKLRDKYIVMRINNNLTLYSMDGMFTITL